MKKFIKITHSEIERKRIKLKKQDTEAFKKELKKEQRENKYELTLYENIIKLLLQVKSFFNLYKEFKSMDKATDKSEKRIKARIFTTSFLALLTQVGIIYLPAEIQNEIVSLLFAGWSVIEFFILKLKKKENKQE